MESLLPPGNQLNKMEDCSNSSHHGPLQSDLWRGDGIKGEEAVVTMVSELRKGEGLWECCFGMHCPGDASKEWCPGLHVSFCPCDLVGGRLRKWPSRVPLKFGAPKHHPRGLFCFTTLKVLEKDPIRSKDPVIPAVMCKMSLCHVNPTKPAYCEVFLSTVETFLTSWV